MDIVLEVVDTFLGDQIFAWALPARPVPYNYPQMRNGTDQVYSTWQYTPATKYLYLEPSPAAYKSAWPRDNIYRQAISLYMMTWYAVHSCFKPSIDAKCSSDLNA
jgi:Delta7-sterol 5-desaturase